MPTARLLFFHEVICRANCGWLESHYEFFLHHSPVLLNSSFFVQYLAKLSESQPSFFSNLTLISLGLKRQVSNMSTPSKEVKALFFDMDNTIINTRDGDVQTCTKLNSLLIEKYGMDMTTAEKMTDSFLRKIRQQGQKPEQPLDEWRISLWKETLEQKYVPFAEEIHKNWLQLRYQYVRLSSEVKSLLCELRSRYRLALISNGNSDRQWEKIRACDVESYFDCIVVSGDTPWKKPNPLIFLKACDELNVKPEHCVMIGDRVETDVEGGKNANLLATVWINSDSSYQSLPNENNYPDFVIKNVLDIKDVLSLLKQWQIS